MGINETITTAHINGDMTTRTIREATNKPMLVTKLDSPLCTRLSSVSMSAVIRDSNWPELSASKKARGWARRWEKTCRRRSLRNDSPIPETWSVWRRVSTK